MYAYEKIYIGKNRKFLHILDVPWVWNCCNSLACTKMFVFPKNLSRKSVQNIVSNVCICISFCFCDTMIKLFIGCNWNKIDYSIICSNIEFLCNLFLSYCYNIHCSCHCYFHYFSVQRYRQMGFSQFSDIFSFLVFCSIL